MTLQDQWLNLLIDRAIAENQHWIQSDHRALAVDEANSILAAGLIIRAVSILDEGLAEYISTNSLSTPSKTRTLNDRLQALNKAGLLLAYKDIDSWRKRRNNVGHKIAETYSWDELERCLGAIHRELFNLKILTDYPALTAKKTVQCVPPTKTGISIEQEITVTIHGKGSDDNVYHQFGWRIRVGG